MSAIRYIGGFPPPYGGVAVKNSLLLEELSSRLDVVPVSLTDVKASGPRGALWLAEELLSSDSPVVFGLSGAWRRGVTRLVSLANRRLASRSTVFVMDGFDPRSGDTGVLNAFRQLYGDLRHEGGVRGRGRKARVRVPESPPPAGGGTRAALASASAYFVDSYIDGIVREISEAAS